MKKLLIGAAVLAIAAIPALAQVPGAPPAPVAPQAMPVPPAPPMAERIHTRDEAVARVREHFARLDANRDGFLTQEEGKAGRAHMKQRFAGTPGESGMRKRRTEHRDPAAAFDRLDANRDGSISRDEFAKGHEMRMQRRMVMKDGQPGGHGGKLHRGMRMHRFGEMMGGHMFVMADANKDGRVSLQEATEATVRHFDTADANRDGRLTPDERRQMHRQMNEKRRAPKAG